MRRWLEQQGKNPAGEPTTEPATKEPKILQKAQAESRTPATEEEAVQGAEATLEMAEV